MRFWPAIALLALSGCNEASKQGWADNYARDNPVGRYQMTSDPKGGAFRLDTRYGNVSHCESTASGTNCDPETSAPN
jgi:hypothetical protein